MSKKRLSRTEIEIRSRARWERWSQMELADAIAFGLRLSDDLYQDNGDQVVFSKPALFETIVNSAPFIVSSFLAAVFEEVEHPHAEGGRVLQGPWLDSEE